MLTGRRLLEAVIVYCKIEVPQNIKEIKSKRSDKELADDKLRAREEEERNKASGLPSYKEINAQVLEKELAANKKLISMTMGEEGNSSGSDSEPSADNLEEEEMAKIAPVKVPAKKPKKEEKKPAPPKKEIKIVKKPQSPIATIKRPPPVIKEISRSPAKRQIGYNAFDRLALRKRKPEMKDAWT